MAMIDDKLSADFDRVRRGEVWEPQRAPKQVMVREQMKVISIVDLQGRIFVTLECGLHELVAQKLVRIKFEGEEA